MSEAAAPARRRRWLVAAGAVVVLAVVAVLVARGIVASAAGRAFLVEYSGRAAQPPTTPVGFDGWAAVTHALNATFLLFTVRSGWRLHRAERPSTFWTRKNDGRIRTRTPPVRISIDLWSHFAGDTLWVLNGVVYIVLTLTTGHWQRLVPSSMEVVPQAVSAGLQYVSLQWPTEDGWVAYNALQQLTYGFVVFVASPIAVLTGLRAAPGFAARLRFLDRPFPARLSKRIHWATMWFLVAFTAVHVFLVLATGAIRNLNHLYALRDDDSPAGALVFGITVIGTVALVLLLRPSVVRAAAAKTGTVLQRPPRKPAR